MTTKSDKIATFRMQYPTLRVGSEETGYTELSSEDYEAKIAEWADIELAAEAAKLAANEAKQAVLNRLGLTEEEAALLLGGN